MRSATLASVRQAIPIDDAQLRRAAWLAAAVLLAVAAIVLDVFVLLAILAGAAAVFGVVSHLDNEAQRDFRAPFNDTWIAVVDALVDDGFEVGDPSWHGVTEGRIRARDAAVRVELHPGSIVRVRVRIGIFDVADNRRRENLILERLIRSLEPESAPR